MSKVSPMKSEKIKKKTVPRSKKPIVKGVLNFDEIPEGVTGVDVNGYVLVRRGQTLSLEMMIAVFIEKEDCFEIKEAAIPLSSRKIGVIEIPR